MEEEPGVKAAVFTYEILTCRNFSVDILAEGN